MSIASEIFFKYVFLGSWHYAFDILSSVAVVTNTALIAMQPSVREYFSSYSTSARFNQAYRRSILSNHAN